MSQRILFYLLHVTLCKWNVGLILGLSGCGCWSVKTCIIDDVIVSVMSCCVLVAWLCGCSAGIIRLAVPPGFPGCWPTDMQRPAGWRGDIHQVVIHLPSATQNSPVHKIFFCDCSLDWTLFNLSPVDLSVVFLIPRLHDEAGSTSWLDERSTSWLDELAIWSFEWCNIANIHQAARRALVVHWSSARRALVEPASSCKRGIT